jgi:hypothetical protein
VGALVLAVGCGGGSGSTRVKGKVLFNNKPLAGATVALESKAKAGRVGYSGLTDDQGEFEIVSHAGKPIPPGRYHVLISKMVDKKGNMPSPEEFGQLQAQGALRNFLPDRYSDRASSDLYAEVKDGENVLPTFKLSGPTK